MKRQRSSTRYGLRRSASYHVLLIVTAVLSCMLAVSASQGDRSPEYQKCVASCSADACRDHVDDSVVYAPADHKMPWVLRVTRWSCLDDCKYHCTHMVTNSAVSRVQHIKQQAKLEIETLAKSQPMSTSVQEAQIQRIVDIKLAELRPVQKEMVQYHGKWVFVRFLGAQEPLSVLFSLMNMRVHVLAFFALRKQLPDAFPLKLVYIVHTLICINAWFWSAIFHTRDKNFTEKLDYYAAASVIMSGFFFSACRLFRISSNSSRFLLFRRVCIGSLIMHMLYLSIGRFDYAYNMAANVVVGLAHNVMWLTYSLRPASFPTNALVDRSAYSRAAMRANKPSLSALSTPILNGAQTPPVPVSTNIGPPSLSNRPRRRLQMLLALMTLAALLELLDFPPILRLLDAHSLWHLATVPITQMWYDWLISDAQECVNTGWWLTDRQTSEEDPTASHFEQIAKMLKGKAASLAQNIELNALTNRLNELANKAGFSGRSENGFGILADRSPTTAAAASASGVHPYASELTEREPLSSTSEGKVKEK